MYVSHLGQFLYMPVGLMTMRLVFLHKDAYFIKCGCSVTKRYEIAKNA